MPILVVVFKNNLERSILSSLINHSVKVFPLFDHRPIMLESQNLDISRPITHDIIYFSNLSRSPISSLNFDLLPNGLSSIRQARFDLPAKKTFSLAAATGRE
jgi:hypothetical protein